MTQQKVGELVSQNMKTLYLWSLSKLSDPYEAEDLCSDIIAAVLTSAENLKCDDAFFGFVWQIARNTYKNYMRRKTRGRTVEIDENIPDNSDILGDICDREELKYLRRELAFLSEKYRICTVSYYFDGLSVKEIAEKYGLTTDTVKVNLFKSRKILKEGIAMDRQFGEKSFNPAPFFVNTIINGKNNDAYNLLTNQLLATQILHSAYYEAMTVEQLSTELGVASVYIEEELKILIGFKLIKKIGEKKYQTNLLVLSKDYLDTAANKMSKQFTARVAEIIAGVKSKLAQIREIDFENNSALSDRVLLWDLYAYLCIKAMQQTDGGAKFRPLYDDTTGVVFAFDHTPGQKPMYSHRCICGRTDETADGKSATLIEFGCLLHEGSPWLYTIPVTEYPRFTNAALERLMSIVSPEFEDLKQIFREVGALQVETLYDFTPDCSKELIEYYCPHITLWNMVGWFGWAALESGALEKPANDENVGIIGYLD